MRKLILMLMCLISIQTIAQEKLRITMKDNTTYEFDIRAIQDVDFYKSTPIVMADIIGDYITYVDNGLATMEFWGFKEDGTLIYDSFYIGSGLNYGADGIYIIQDNVLTMTLWGTNFSERLSTCSSTKLVGSSYVFYKIQATYTMSTSDESLSIGTEGDVIKYVDNCYVGIDGNKIIPLRSGIGYALVEDAKTQDLKAYKITVNSAE